MMLTITAPDLRRACYTSAKNDKIRLEFDQPVAWIDPLAGQFFLDGQAGKVVSGTVALSLIHI